MKRGFKTLIFIFIFMIIGIINVNAEDNNVVAAYKYDEKYCLTGKETTCIKTMCYSKNSKEACKAGDIIQYKVNTTETQFFHVMYDGDYTGNMNNITLQSQETLLIGTPWNENATNTNGPVTALTALGNYTNTNKWDNVLNQTFELGTTVFETNAYTGCDGTGCTGNTYSMSSQTLKARMITTQEAISLGCTDKKNSCPIWMYNYLSTSKENGGSNNVNGVEEYWTMSASKPDVPSDSANIITSLGKIESRITVKTVDADIKFGIRPVIVIAKPNVDTSNFSEGSYENQNNGGQADKTADANKGDQTVKVADTLKTAYIGYCIGIIVLIAGIVVLVQFYRKNKISNQ